MIHAAGPMLYRITLDSEYIGYTSSTTSEQIGTVWKSRFYIRMCHRRTNVPRMDYDTEQHSVSSQHLGYNEKSRLNDVRYRCDSTRMPTLVLQRRSSLLTILRHLTKKVHQEKRSHKRTHATHRWPTYRSVRAVRCSICYRTNHLLHDATSEWSKGRLIASRTRDTTMRS